MINQPLEFDIVEPKLNQGYSIASYYLIMIGSLGIHFYSMYKIGVFTRRFYESENSIFDVVFWILSITLFILFFIYLKRLEVTLFPLRKSGRFVIGADRFVIYNEGVRKEVLFDTLEHIRKANGIGLSNLSPLAYNLKFVYKDYSKDWVCSVDCKNEEFDLESVIKSHKEMQRLQIEMF